ncbi:MAG: ketosynthase chain-length factor, partial [Pseudonocardia sp.]|nr:ketosynthase chain-length factor [Pseudonocardia sp.]
MSIDTDRRPVGRDRRTAKAVVTGIGIASPIGLGPTQFWRAALRGEPGIRPITRFDTSGYWAKIGGEVPHFEADRHLQGKLLPQTDHMTRLTLVGTDWALRGAGVRPNDIASRDMAVITAATAGGYEFGQREMQKLWHQGPDHVSTYQSFAWFYAVNTGQISIRHGTKGPGAVLVSEQAGGLDAIGHARRQLRGGTKLALTGGIDSSLCPWAWVAHQVSGSLSRRNDPATAYLPFSRDANGFVAGEGGAIMVLETEESAAERPGTRIYGQIAGYASTFDSRNPDRPPGLKRAAEQAMADAEVDPADVDLVFADACGIPEEDRKEAAALAELFGPYGVPVTAPKTMTGRLFAGGSSLDVASALLSIYWSAIPPTINVADPDPAYELDLVTEARHQTVRVVLVLARGRGGFNSAIVVREHR